MEKENGENETKAVKGRFWGRFIKKTAGRKIVDAKDIFRNSAETDGECDSCGQWYGLRIRWEFDMYGANLFYLGNVLSHKAGGTSGWQL